MARKTYTREFKLQALRMLTDQGLSVAEVARQLRRQPSLTPSWRAASATERPFSVSRRRAWSLNSRV